MRWGLLLCVASVIAFRDRGGAALQLPRDLEAADARGKPGATVPITSAQRQANMDAIERDFLRATNKFLEVQGNEPEDQALRTQICEEISTAVHDEVYAFDSREDARNRGVKLFTRV